VKLLIVRHAVAMERSDYQREAYLADPADEASDEFRPLTQSGIRKMRKNSKALAQLIERPYLIISSPLTRARQTAQILSEAWKGTDVIFNDDLKPGSRPADLIKWFKHHLEGETPQAGSVETVGRPSIKAQTETSGPQTDAWRLAKIATRESAARAMQDRPLVLVGHNPHLPALISWLLFGATGADRMFDVKKGGACLLEFRLLPAKAKGRLLWLAPPKLLN
jgi:phosphohistidine phosphatase SixA